MTAVYLLRLSNGYLQIDTGYTRDYPTYRSSLSKLGIAADDIKVLVLTHHHDDHAGFLNDLTRDTPLTIIAHEQAKALLMTGKNDKSRGGGYVNPFVKFIADVKMRLDSEWTLTFPPFEMRPNDILIGADDNSILRQLGVSGKLLYTPGHCIDHLALVLDTGEVFCGDAAASFPLFAGIQYCPVFMTDMEEAYRSWQKILEAGGRMIYPSHGKPFQASKLCEHMGKIRTQDLVKFF
jgi:glyoxylase-like metal-dependent hydrolase (beta-lactamase superfamily II)